jgi:hypothetical protein
MSNLLRAGFSSFSTIHCHHVGSVRQLGMLGFVQYLLYKEAHLFQLHQINMPSLIDGLLIDLFQVWPPVRVRKLRIRCKKILIKMRLPKGPANNPHSTFSS